MRLVSWSAPALFMLAYAAHAGMNSWSARGPYGGRVVDLDIDPSNGAIVYAASSYSLFKSTDGGANWVELPHDMGAYPRVDVTVDPSNPTRVYASSIGSGVFRSTNGGATFTRISAGPTDVNVDGPAIFAISADGNALYYSTNSGLFFRSTNAGASFTAGASTSAGIRSLVVDPSNSQVLYASAGAQLLKSTNAGSSWQSLTLPPPSSEIYSIRLVPGSPATLWVANSTNVYSTQNDGGLWTAATPVLGSRMLYQDVNTPGHLFAAQPLYGDGGDIWQFLAGTWQSLAGPLPAGVTNLAAMPGNSQVLLATTASGVYRSVNGGGTWARSDTGLTAARVQALASVGGRVYAGTEHGEMGIASGDGILQRKVVRSTMTGLYRTQLSAIAVRPSNPNFILAGFNGAGYRYSSDGGTTWLDGAASLDTAWMDALAIDPTNEQLVYASVRPSSAPLEKLWRSVDGGVTFDPLASNVSNVWASKLTVDPQNPARLFLMSSQVLNPGDVLGLLRSSDSGATWTLLSGFSTDFALDPTDSKRLYGASGSAFLVSENSGDTFAARFISGPLVQIGPVILSIAVDPVVSSVVYAAAVYANESFVMRSVDRGSSWERIPSSIQPNWLAWKLAVNSADDTVLVAATSSSGVYSFRIAPDLAASIAGHSGTKPVGVQSFYDVQARNNGPFAATNLVFSSTFPPGAQNVSASIPNGSCVVATTAVQCTLASLPLNGMASARVNYTPSSAGTLPVQATVSAREADPSLSDNTAIASAMAGEVADLVTTGSASTPTPDRGTAFTYTFQVRNAGPNASSATHLTVAAAPGVAVTSSSSSACVVSGATVTCDLGSLASDATATVTVSATATSAATLRTTASATGAASAVDPDTSNNIVNVDIVSREPPSSGGGSDGGGGGMLGSEWLLALTILWLYRARRWRAEVK